MIGYYAHHHGSGHVRRAAAVGEELAGAVTVLSSAEAPTSSVPWVVLPRDDDPMPTSEADTSAGGALHWAPLRHAGMQARHVRIATWAASQSAQLIVSDVSIEVLMLARLLSVPAVAVALRGDRHDVPHQTGFAAASRIIAPWPRLSQHPWPDSWLQKTTWVGSISRYDGRPAESRTCALPGRCVLWLFGTGGHSTSAWDLHTVGEVPDTHWHVLGPLPAARRGTYQGIDLAGWVHDPWPYLCQADIVVASGGDNAIADVAAARKPLIVVPQPRPFDEQAHHARILENLGLAHVLPASPSPRDWGRVLDRAQKRGGEPWVQYHDGRGASRMASALRQLAADPTAAPVVQPAAPSPAPARDRMACPHA